LSASPKILHVISDLDVGGAETMLVRLACAEREDGGDIAVASLISGGFYADRLRAAGVRLEELGVRGAFGPVRGLVRLVRLMRDYQPDVVQGWMYHGDLAALLGLCLSGRRRRTGLIWGIRGSAIELGHYRLQLRVVMRLCAWLSRCPDLVTANSEEGLRVHRAYGYRPRKAEVVPNGIDTDLFKPDPAARAALRGELGLSEDDVVFVQVARVDPMKDHRTALEAKAALPQVKLMLIGAGTERLPAQENVLRLGRRSDVARLLPAADFALSSSAFGEGFSNAIAEAMAGGLPVVATDVGDAGVIVGDTGKVVLPRDPAALAAAMTALAGEPPVARADRASKARRRIVENFGFVRLRERLHGLYATVRRSA
jgi:glycosyltransferase involved in cell wall biosynthesis